MFNYSTKSIKCFHMEHYLIFSTGCAVQDSTNTLYLQNVRTGCG